METNTKHTAGPWEVGQYGNSFIVTAKERMYDVAVIRNIGNEDNEANARLIAAAPNLLRELQRLLAAYRQAVKLHDPNTDDAYTVGAHNAIAKATSH